MKTLIGVVASPYVEPRFHLQQNIIGSNYVESVAKAGGLPIMIPITLDEEQIGSYVDLCDGFLFCGGADLNPLLFGENPHPLLGDTNLDFDNFQLSLIGKVLTAKKPLLGICRGEQLLNVACGGTLYQDISLQPKEPMKHMQSEVKRYSVSHKVTFTEGSLLYDIFGKTHYVNSFHHQSVKNLGTNLRTTGLADDDTIEGIEVIDHPFQVGVQWHPENFIQVTDSMIPLFAKLVETASKKDFE